MLPWALNRTRSVACRAGLRAGGLPPVSPAASNSAAVSHRPRAMRKAKFLGIVWLRGRRWLPPTRRSAAAGPARWQSEDCCASGPPGRPEGSTRIGRKASADLQNEFRRASLGPSRRTPKGPTGDDGTSRGIPTVPVRSPEGARSPTTPRTAPKSRPQPSAQPRRARHRWFERPSHAKPEDLTAVEAARHRRAHPKVVVDAPRVTHPEGWRRTLTQSPKGAKEWPTPEGADSWLRPDPPASWRGPVSGQTDNVSTWSGQSAVRGPGSPNGPKAERADARASGARLWPRSPPRRVEIRRGSPRCPRRSGPRSGTGARAEARVLSIRVHRSGRGSPTGRTGQAMESNVSMVTSKNISEDWFSR